MKMYTELKQEVTVITKNATPYNVDGNSGITYRLVIMLGDDVEKGDVIGYVGSTGRSTGPHVHLEIRIDGVIYNPAEFLDI